MKTIGDRIKEARETAKLTQAELASKTGYCAHHISNLECDRYKPSSRALMAFERALGTRIVK